VAVYARYSSDRQSEASIEDQVRRCRAFAVDAGAIVDDALVFADYAVSGASLARAGLEAMLAAVAAGRVDAIVVEDMSRLSRDLADAASVFRRLQFEGVSLLGVADGIDSREKSSKLTFGVRALLADAYLDDLRDKTRRGLEGRHLAGFSTGGLPYGYRSEPEHDARGEVRGYRIQIDDGAARIVRRIFALALGGHSLSSIATTLNAERIPPPRSSMRRRDGWAASTVRSMLRNEKYRGAWSFNRREWRKAPETGRRRSRARDPREVVTIDRPELAIVDVATWDAVAARLEAVAAKYQGKGGAHDGRRTLYPLSGVLRCGCCGSPMSIVGPTGRARYMCTDARKRGTCTNRLTVLESTARTLILDALEARLRRPAAIAYLRARIAALLGELGRESSSELRERRERLGRTERKARALVELLAAGETSTFVREALHDLEAAARAERASIAGLEAVARAPRSLPSPDELAAGALGLRARVERDPAGAREVLLRTFPDGLQLRPEEDEGVYVAEGAMLPLIVLTEAGTPPSASPAALSSDGCGGAMRALVTAIREDFSVRLAA
jgi:DNA invertase Pin-like site-specific DNA recombinase